MKFLVLLSLLLSSVAFASPITVDQIIAPDGLTLSVGRGTILVPSGYVTEQLLTQTASQLVLNKTFDRSSNVMKQLRLVYDVPTMGGATNANISLGAGLPAKAIIDKVIIDVPTSPVAMAGSPTIGISAATGADILADTAIASVTGVVAGKPNGSTTNMIKLTGATNMTVNIKSGSLSAGQLVIFVDYLLSQ